MNGTTGAARPNGTGPCQMLTLRHLQNAFVSQCVIVAWQLAHGAAVQGGDVLAEVETQKVTAVICAKQAGVLHHKYAQGDYVDVTDVIGWVE